MLVLEAAAWDWCSARHRYPSSWCSAGRGSTAAGSPRCRRHQAGFLRQGRNSNQGFTFVLRKTTSLMWQRSSVSSITTYLSGCADAASWDLFPPGCCPSPPVHSWSCRVDCLWWSAGSPEEAHSLTRGPQGRSRAPPRCPEETQNLFNCIGASASKNRHCRRRRHYLQEGEVRISMKVCDLQVAMDNLAACVQQPQGLVVVLLAGGQG